MPIIKNLKKNPVIKLEEPKLFIFQQIKAKL